MLFKNHCTAAFLLLTRVSCTSLRPTFGDFERVEGFETFATFVKVVDPIAYVVAHLYENVGSMPLHVCEPLT